MLDDEIQNIKNILADNGYPRNVIERNVQIKLSKLASLPEAGPKKCPVYLKLPYLGERSIKIVANVRKVVNSTYNSVTLRTMYSTTTILPSSKKDVLPIHKTSNVIYKFTCKRCESAYIGRTSQRLGDRISQHVPRLFRISIAKSLHERTETGTPTHFLRKRIPTPLKLPSYVESAIGMHLLENPACAATYDDTDFKILSKPRNLFQLNVLEALYINSLKPTLCRQKKFVYFCRLFPNSFINK